MSNLCVKNGNITTNYIDITQSGNDFNSGVPTASFHPHTNILLSSKHSARAERFQCFFRVFRFLICIIIYRFFTYRFTTTKRILLTRDYQETRFSIELKQTTARFCVFLTIHPSVIAVSCHVRVPPYCRQMSPLCRQFLAATLMATLELMPSTAELAPRLRCCCSCCCCCC